MTAAIRFDELTMRFRRASGAAFTAVDQLTLDIAAGQVYGLLGPNGSGKTTTVNLLAGLLKPSAGTIRLHDIDVSRNVGRARALLGVVPQETALYNDLSALENLRFHARLYQVPAAQRQARIAEMLELVGLTARRHDRVGTYSGGMQRRLALARALLTRPAVIVLDEPTLGVDVQSRAAIWERVRALAEAGNTVLLTTNYMEEAQALANRLAIIDHGRLVAEGTPAELQQQAGQRTINIEADWQPAQQEELRRLPGIQAVEWQAPCMRLIIGDGAEPLPELLAYLNRETPAPRSITMKEPDLNDVFLQLTGRSLRD
jgi:ABC-2 type transport system ATP-binding protein